MADQKKEEMITLYHYTSEENASAIRKKGEIKPSEDGAFGGGKVYLTDVKPSVGKGAIARNNYDGLRAWEYREAKGAVDSHIKVTLPASKVQKEQDPQGRRIYTHEGPIKLADSGKK